MNNFSYTKLMLLFRLSYYVSKESCDDFSVLQDDFLLNKTVASTQVVPIHDPL